MGKDKALLLVDGMAMAARVALALRAAGAGRVVAIGGDAVALARLGLETVPDEAPGEGPLPATIQAIEWGQGAIVVVAGCDLVDPRAEVFRAVVRALADTPGALGAVPVLGGHRQWMHAAWRVEAAPVLRAARVGGGHSLLRAAAGLDLVELADLPAAALADADDPSQLPDRAG